MNNKVLKSSWKIICSQKLRKKIYKFSETRYLFIYLSKWDHTKIYNLTKQKLINSALLIFFIILYAEICLHIRDIINKTAHRTYAKQQIYLVTEYLRAINSWL